MSEKVIIFFNRLSNANLGRLTVFVPFATCLLLLAGCGVDSGFAVRDLASNSGVPGASNVGSTPSPATGPSASPGSGAGVAVTPTATPAASSTPASTPVPGPTPSSSSEYNVEVAPLWEAARPADGKAWTQYAFAVVDQYGTALLGGTSDIKTFCPKYLTMTRNQKINFWVYLASGIVKYESDFSPTSRYQETTLGTDAVTGLPVWSEGLMQLSYQDQDSYSFCNEFNWSVDKKLSPKDPSKTILDPYKNLRCGIRILNTQVANHDMIAYRGYWSTLFPTSSALSSIRALANQQNYCF